MSIIETGNYANLSPSDLQAVKDAAKERAAAMLRIDAEKDLMKEISDKVKDDFKIKTGDFNALATMYHKQDILAREAAFENRKELYVMVFGEVDQPEAESDE